MNTTNFFVSRYGLLYLKTSNDPFSGRILTVEWVRAENLFHLMNLGKKVKSTGKAQSGFQWHPNVREKLQRRQMAWFSNPLVANGQKMYIRAYTNGVRHGSEATWRSDGTPLSLPANGTPTAIETEPVTEESADSLPGVDLESSPVMPTTDVEPAIIDFTPRDPVITDEPAPLGLSDPLGQSAEESSPESFSDLPTFPPMDEEVPEPNGIVENPILPPSSTEFAAPDALPPAIPESSLTNYLFCRVLKRQMIPKCPLPLPGLPAESDDGGLPLSLEWKMMADSTATEEMITLVTFRLCLLFQLKTCLIYSTT